MLLFDIDGTLLQCGGAGGGALLEALKAEFGLRDAKPVALHGRTDRGILSDLLTNHGQEASESNFRRLAEAYFGRLPAELQRRSGRVLPGAMEVLQRLSRRSDVLLAVLTGNLPESARMKLEHFGMSGFFHFGIFGDAAAHRPDLAEPAWQVIREHCPADLEPRSVTIIGDTPLDVELARSMGARCLGVTTGGFDVEALKAAGADLVMDGLQDVSTVEEWLVECAVGDSG